MKKEHLKVMSFGSISIGLLLGISTTLLGYKYQVDSNFVSYALDNMPSWLILWELSTIASLALLAWDAKYKNEPEEKSTRSFLFFAGALSPIIFVFVFFIGNPIWSILFKDWPEKYCSSWKEYWNEKV